MFIRKTKARFYNRAVTYTFGAKSGQNYTLRNFTDLQRDADLVVSGMIGKVGKTLTETFAKH